MKIRYKGTICLWVILTALLLSIQVTAQSETVISVAVPELMKASFENLADEFMAQNNGVRVDVVTYGGFSPSFGDPNEVNEFLDNVQDYVSTADVLVLDTPSLIPGLLSSGYFLDLSPLATSDPDLNLEDFYPALLEGFQVDDGLWALPVSGRVNLMFYDPEAFDTAGLAYPTEDWMIADMDYAIRQLTRFSDTGELLDAGFQNLGRGTGAIFASLADMPLLTMTTDGTIPQFDEAGIDSIIDTWAKLESEGYFGAGFFSTDAETVPPMTVGPTFIGRAFDEDSQPLAPMLLPGGQAGVDTTGFAVSAGTQFPELAYAFTKFLTTTPVTATLFFDGYPARRSLQGVDVVEGDGFVFETAGEESPELQAVIQSALQNAIPANELIYANYLQSAIEAINQGTEIQTALREAEDEIIELMRQIEENRDDIVINIPVKAGRPALSEGEIELKFGATAFISPFPNKDRWEAAAQEFADQDPEVGYVAMDTSFPQSTADMAERYDCFYLPYNVVQATDLSLLRSLDPLMSSDPTFDAGNMVGNVLEQVTRNGQIYGFPISIEPKAMRVNPTMFSRAGVPLPQGSWTVADFEDALRALDEVVASDEAVYQPAGFGNSHLLTLIAAYGGLPVDYRTNPPTIDLTSPANIEAIRQVLNLVKDGLMEYQTLTPTLGGFDVVMAESLDDTPTAIYDEVVNGFGFGGGGMMIVGGNVDVREGGSDAVAEPDVLVTFPMGAQLNGLSYTMSVGYISANTTYTDACYRWLSFLSNRGDLLVSMPANRALLDAPEIVAEQGEEAVDFYRAMDELMQQPNTILFPSGDIFQPDASLFIDYWMNRAFDRYVLEDADLDAELDEAQAYTQGYLDCVASVPAYDPQTGDVEQFVQAVEACIAQVDPTVEF